MDVIDLLQPMTVLVITFSHINPCADIAEEGLDYIRAYPSSDPQFPMKEQVLEVSIDLCLIFVHVFMAKDWPTIV